MPYPPNDGTLNVKTKLKQKSIFKGLPDSNFQVDWVLPDPFKVGGVFAADRRRKETYFMTKRIQECRRYTK